MLAFSQKSDNFDKSSIPKKQSQRFALQELLKQFLVMSRYITAFSYTKKEVPQKISAIPLSIKSNIKIILTQ